MKIVLVRPNYDSHIITPPLGIGYLSAYLQHFGEHEVILIDALCSGETNSEVIEKIKSIKPDAVGITCLTAFYFETVDLSKRLKELGHTVLVGGVHPTFLPKQTLEDSHADYVICGEGEKAFLDLADSGFSDVEIQGVYSLADAPEKDAIKAKPVKDLDSIPFPDWAQIDPRTYPRAPHGAIVKNFPIGVITSTRGCPYECTFCASPMFYERTIRYRSPENVVDEIEHLVTNYGVKEIHFEDDNLTLKRDHIEAICNGIIERNLKISWACPNGIRADRVDESLIRLMKKSGCYYFAYGVESANNSILANIKKHEKVEQINESIDLAARIGIQCQGFFIFGLPGENKETIENSINFAVKSKLSRAQFLVLDVLPGSGLWSDLKGKFVPDWGKASYKEPEWMPDGLTREDIVGAQSRAFRKFYLRPVIFARLMRMISPSQIKFLLHRLLDFRILKQ